MHWAEAKDTPVRWTPSPSYAQRIDSLLTVYLSLDEEKLVGCQIKGFGRIMERLKSFHVIIKNRDVQLTMLFLACRALAEDPGPLPTYQNLAKEAGERKVSLPSDLVAA